MSATLTIGGKEVRGTSGAYHVARLAALYDDVARKAHVFGELEAKLKKQQQWLNANDPESPVYDERIGIYWRHLLRRKRQHDELTDLAREADGIVRQMDATTKAIAEARTPGARLGSAHVWCLIERHAPFRRLFAESEAEARAQIQDQLGRRAS